MSPRTTKTFALLLLLLPAGCDPRVFNDFKNDSPIAAFAKPGNYNGGGFGLVVSSSAGLLGDAMDTSMVLASAGADTPVPAFTVWNDGALAIAGRPKFTVCTDADQCATGRGTAFAGVPRWQMHNGCVIMGMPSTGTVHIACEDAMSSQTELPPAPMSDEATIRLGASVAAIPTSSDLGADLSAGTVPTPNAVGVAFLGAPDGDVEAGRIYRLPDGAHEQIVDLTAAMLPAMGHLGEAVASALLPDDGSFTALSAPVLLVAGAPDAGRVVLAAVGDDTAGGTGIQAEVLACLDSTNPGFGGVVGTADVDGDGIPEVYVGAGMDTVGRAEEVDVYVLDPTVHTGAVGCDGMTTLSPTDTLGCPADAEGASCLGFGSSLASGDVNGDGYQELLVGAPESTVDGNVRAGVGYLFPGTGTGLDTASVDVLRHAHPTTDAHMGQAATMVWSQLALPMSGPRVEPVLGAPGANVVYVFLCSALADDTSANGSRCVAGN